MATNLLNIKFSAGGDAVYAELPVPAAYLRWTRGDAGLGVIKDVDPARYFGGWRANVLNKEGDPFPSLPLPVVDRVSQDGRKTYQVYASNVVEFLPLQHRTRFEKRETVVDPVTGEERTKVTHVSKGKLPGYAPNKQIFGLLFVGDQYAPAVLIADKWSSFISFNRAEGKWGKVKVPAGKALVRKFGTVGVADKTTGRIVPNFETFGQSLSTPIEAIDLNKPRFIDVTEEIGQLYYDAMDWADCPRWHATDEGSQDDTLSAKSKFLKRVEELGFDNITIEQLLAEANGDYRTALKNIEEGEPTAVEGDEEFPY